MAIELVAMTANVLFEQRSKLGTSRGVGHRVEQQSERLEAQVCGLPGRSGAAEIRIEAAVAKSRCDGEQLRGTGVSPHRETLDGLGVEQRLERFEHDAIGV